MHYASVSYLRGAPKAAIVTNYNVKTYGKAVLAQGTIISFWWQFQATGATGTRTRCTV